MDSSCGESSGGVKAGEELWKKSVIQAPTSVLQAMRERDFLLEIQEKKWKEEQEKKEKKELLEYSQLEWRRIHHEKEEREKLRAKAKANAEEGPVKAREKSKGKRAKAKDRANTEECAEKAKANAEEGAGKAREKPKARRAKAKDMANAEEAARPTNLSHSALMSGESSIELKAKVELRRVSKIRVMKRNERNPFVERRKAQEAAEAKAKSEEAAREEAVGVAPIAESWAEEADRIAESEAKEVDETEGADNMAKLEAAESARIAKAKADEAAKAKEGADEAWHEETEWAQCEGELFAAKFRSFWNEYYTDCGNTFEQTTSIPAMCHTYPASDCSTKAMDTLQIMSVKVTSIKNGLGLHWPLEVFGIIAARDVLDHKRNIIFDRPRTDCQAITQDDCYLALTGPTRAVAVSVDPSYIEVSLKVKGTTESEDKDLSDLVLMYRTGCCPGSVYPSRLSTLEIIFRHINCSVEATVHIKVIGGSWPDGFRGVFSAGTSISDDLQVKLLDFEDGGLPVNADGQITLSRRVVSVGVENNLKVSVMACPINKGHATESSEALLKSQRAGTSPPGIKLSVGSCSMEVSVAWSCFRRAW